LRRLRLVRRILRRLSAIDLQSVKHATRRSNYECAQRPTISALLITDALKRPQPRASPPGVHRCVAAGVLKSNQVQWSAKGGAYVEVYGASSVRPTGFLTVPIAVSSRQLGLPRRLHMDIDACIMGIPGQDEPSGRGM
jgi:hypothetical protein